MTSKSILAKNWTEGQRELQPLTPQWVRDCEYIEAKLGRQAYLEWIETAPDNNHDFNLAAAEKARELRTT